ncbi:MAG TPA: NAD-dependent succinate-semialdehyde dehydrogenase [Gammaproteobacteria bacterium]
MPLESVNPATGETVGTYEKLSEAALDRALDEAVAAQREWALVPVAERAALMNRAAQVLREQRDEFARVITEEMGKLVAEARAEVEKCAKACEYYAKNGPRFLADEVIETDARRSWVACQPLGVVLAVMPWNFPFWQVFRFAAPALVAGNGGLLKHASNVPGCALAIERVFREAGFPEGLFRSLLIDTAKVEGIISDPRVSAATLTGSEPAGRAVAAQAGKALKKTVLELGGSDAFVVLDDADLDAAAEWGAKARYQNAGQSCIAAKRFILIEDIADAFLEKFRAHVGKLKPGNPADAHTTLAPMARKDLRDDLHEQVEDALAKGATAVLGCRPVTDGEFGSGAYYEASILADVKENMRAWREELFGPVAIVIRVKDETEALEVANGVSFGLGGCVWTRDAGRGEKFALRLECGAAFVNGMVKSDPRLPFGGVKDSGYGRELSHHGIREFVNEKSVWVGE